MKFFHTDSLNILIIMVLKWMVNKQMLLFRDELAKAPIKHFDSTLETIDRLAQNNKLYIVTNGVTDTQKDVSLNYNLKTYLMVYLYQRKPVIKSQ